MANLSVLLHDSLVRSLDIGAEVLEQRVTRTTHRVNRVARRASLVMLLRLVSAVLLLVAWFTACAALKNFLAPRWSLSGARLMLSGLHLVAGATLLLVMVSLRRPSRSRSLKRSSR